MEGLIKLEIYQLLIKFGDDFGIWVMLCRAE